MEKYTGIEKYNGTRKYSKLIERRFFQKEKIERAVWEAKNDSGSVKTGGGGHAFVSDPTANKALRNVVPLKSVDIEVGKNEVETIRDPEKWLQVIHATYRRYEGGVAYKILQDRYRGESQVKTCIENFISKATYYFILKEIENYSIMCACQVGLIRVF